MPYLVTCTHCASKLKSPQPVPAGRELVCPRCQTKFTLATAAPEIVDPPAPTPATPTMAPRPQPKPAPAVAKKNDEDDIPEAVFDDDPPPKKRRRDEDEDERPRSKRRRDDDDEEDDLPRTKRRAKVDEDDEEDERPRSKRRRVDDDEEDDRDPPRRADDEDDDDSDDRGRRSKSRKKKGKKGLILALIGGLAAMFLLCGGAALMYFVDPFGMFQSGISSEMLAWAPPDAKSVVFTDVENAEKIDELKNKAVGVSDMASFGVRKDEIASTLAFGRGLFGAGEVNVIKLRSNADKKKIIEAAGGKEVSAEGSSYYTVRGGAMHFASDSLLITCKSESTLKSLLKGGSSRGASKELRAIAKKGDGLLILAAVDDAAAGSDMLMVLSATPNLGEMFGNPTGGGVRPKARSTVLSLNASGDRARLRIETDYGDSASADRVASDLRKALDMKRHEYETYTVSTSGGSVTMKASGPIKGSGRNPLGL